MRTWKQTIKRIVAVLVIVLALPAIANAAQSESADYQVNEVFFGAGGALNDCSTNYCSKQSIGETAVGNTKSASYQAQAGFNTDRGAYIQFTVNDANINLGTLSTTSTAYANATFSVKTYLADGYSVINASPPPTNESHQLTPIGPTPAASQAGTEQFGINLADNLNPNTNSGNFGAAPVQVPNSSFAYGYASVNYDTPNNYMYAEGATGGTIAQSDSSTGETDYTVSYIFNISHVTPGGTYTFHHVIVATSTY